MDNEEEGILVQHRHRVFDTLVLVFVACAPMSWAYHAYLHGIPIPIFEPFWLGWSMRVLLLLVTFVVIPDQLCELLTRMSARSDGLHLMNPFGTWGELDYDEVGQCRTKCYEGEGEFLEEVVLIVRLRADRWTPPLAAPVHGAIASLFGASFDWVLVEDDREQAVPFLKRLKANDVQIVPEELDDDLEAALESEQAECRESSGPGSAKSTENSP